MFSRRFGPTTRRPGTHSWRPVVDWGFRSGLLQRVEALVMTTDEASIALLERTGLRRERLLPGHRAARGFPRDFYPCSVEPEVSS